MKIKLHNFIAFTVLLASAIVGLCFYSEWSGMAEENQQLLEHRKQLQAQVDAYKTQTDKTAQIKKKNQKAQLERFKSQYFDYYDDIKLTPKDDW